MICRSPAIIRLWFPFAIFLSMAFGAGLVVFMYTPTPNIPIVFEIGIITGLTVSTLACMTWTHHLYSQLSVHNLRPRRQALLNDVTVTYV